MSGSFDLEAPDHFTAGSVGPPGQRVFYLQARESGTLVTLKAEKEHVNGLAQYLAGLMVQLPGDAPRELPRELDLLEPVDAAWTIGSLGVGYDQTHDRIIVVASELVEGAEEDDEGTEDGETVERAAGVEAEEPPAEAGAEPAEPGAEPAEARFRITRAQAAAFVERARLVVRGGRPTCPMCGRPQDAEGHVCPRANGHVAR